MTTLAFTLTALRWRWATRRAARAAWRTGQDVIDWWGQVMASTAETLWPDPGTQTPCQVCEGRHCAGCDEPIQHMADDIGHMATHTPERLPQSIVADVMLWASPVDRARSASLRMRAASARILRAEVLAHRERWTRKLGRVPQIGVHRKVVWP